MKLQVDNPSELEPPNNEQAKRIRKHFVKLTGCQLSGVANDQLSGNYPGRKFSVWELSREGYPGWEFFGWELSGWEVSLVGVFRVGIIQVAILRVGVFTLPTNGKRALC